jgi:hypothetical protein
MTGALFDMAPVVREPEEKLSADRRRTIRQAQALARRRHPLGLAFGIPVPLHADAPPADNRDAPGPRCGDCLHIARVGYHDSSYLKCTRGGSSWPWVTHGAATDLRAWWPGCEKWQARP